MLAEIRIRNFAIIEEASLEFGAGLNVLSGETGAGKTIIMTALGLLLGDRASPEMVRVDQKEAVVEGLFELEGEGPAPIEAPAEAGRGPRELLIRRVVAEGSRSRVQINGELGTVQALARAAANLVQLYGQHEQQSLLRVESHLQILDRYAALDAELADYHAAHRRSQEVRERLLDLERREKERANLLELARFQAAELERAVLVADEDQQLGAERTVLANAAKLSAATNQVEQMLYGGEAAAIDTIAKAQTQLTEAASLDSTLGEPLELIGSARTALQEAARSLSSYAGRIEADPERLEQIEQRLQELTRLKRKYGGSIASALATLERAHTQIAELENIGESKAAIDRELAGALDRQLQIAKAISARRTEAAAELKRKMEAELRTLGMKSAVFEPRIEAIAAAETALVHNGLALGPNGADAVEFYISPNLGQPPMALARIASGGELSRVMLALKRLEATRRGVATVIFDEVDAGIGGAVAEVVGRKLKQLARFHQVLCITHLPQIAAFADTHFLVEKVERRGATTARVIALDKSQRTEELARMIGGAEITDKLRRAAKELIDRAHA